MSAKCKSCGRALSAARSVQRGRGPVCQRRYLQRVRDAVAASGQRQVDKATELLADGGLVRLASHRGRVFRAVSTDGRRTYLVSATGQCNCPAGLHERYCYHAIAAKLAA